MVAVALAAVAIALAIHVAGLGDRSRRLASLAKDYAGLAAMNHLLQGESLTAAVQAERASQDLAESARQALEQEDKAGAGPLRRQAEDRAAYAVRLKEASELWSRRGDYHDGLSKKYSNAARRPILPVWPDPPEP